MMAKPTNGGLPASAGPLEKPSSSAGSITLCTNTDLGSGDASRAPSSSEEDGKPTSSSSDSKPTRKRVRKPRKATNTMRREEIAVLQQQLDRLQAKLRGMQPQPSIVSHAESCGDCVEIKSSSQTLREAVKQQHLMLATAHAIFSEYSRLQPTCATDRFVRLGRDRALRQATLLRMKAAKIADAHAFLERRCPRMEPRRRFTDSQQFDTPDGDIIAVRLRIETLHGARSVKQAYEIMLNQMDSLEIRVSDQLGNITIREDDDSGDKEFQQIRLVSSTTGNVPLESNSVVFHSYTEKDDFNAGRECAIVASDFVDEDALYPYRPSERVRRDTCGIIRLTAHKMGPREEDVEIMVTRYAHMRLHQPKFPVSREAWQDTVLSIDRWSEVFLSSISDVLKMET